MRKPKYAALRMIVAAAGLVAAASFLIPGARAQEDRLHQPLDLKAYPPSSLPPGDAIRRPAPPETIPGGTPLRDPIRRPSAPSGLLPERPKKPEEIPLPPLPEPKSPLPRPGSSLGSGQERPAASDPPAPVEVGGSRLSETTPPATSAELERLLATVRQEDSVSRLAECAPRLAEHLVESSQAGSFDATRDLSTLIDGLSLAFNVQSAAARLQGDWAAHLRALEQFRSQLEVLHRQTEDAFRAGAAGVDERQLLLAGYHLEKITAVLERDRKNREAETEALRKAADHAQSLRSACEKSQAAGRAGIAWLPDVTRYEYAAMAKLIARTTPDPAQAREARIAALQRCLDDLRQFSQAVATMYREGAIGGDAMAYSLALYEVEEHSAMLADLRGDAAARISALKEAVVQAEKHSQALAAKSEAGHPTSAPEWLEASKCLCGAKVRLAVAVANGVAEARQTQRETFQMHRDRVATVLREVEARYRQGRRRRIGGGTGLRRQSISLDPSTDCRVGKRALLTLA